MQTEFPKIRGLKWVSDTYPDLVIIRVALESTTHNDLGIPGFKPEQTIMDYHLDLSLLAGIRDWIERGCDTASETECLVDFNGMSQMALLIRKEDLIKAWVFYKDFKYNKV